MMKLLAEDLMESEIVSLNIDMSIEQANQILSSEKISGAPVFAEGKLVGILSKTDINNYLAYKAAAKDIIELRSVASVMTTDIICVPPDTEITEVASIMTNNQIHRILVCNNEKLLGIISAMDFVKILQLTNIQQQKPAAMSA